jgi:hypothetical protein
VAVERATVIGSISRNPGVTVRATPLLLTPFADAVICVVPGHKPVTRPLAELIAATTAALLEQLRVTPCITLPVVSLAVAVNCAVPLTRIEERGADRVTLARTGTTVPP